jgi:hypothetical protein
MVVPIGILLSTAAGLVYAIFAAYLYFRFERSVADSNVFVAMSAFATFYFLAFVLRFAISMVLVPTILLFFMGLALVFSIWYGSQARSKAGLRMALAGSLTFVSFVCCTALRIYPGSNMRCF